MISPKNKKIILEVNLIPMNHMRKLSSLTPLIPLSRPSYDESDGEGVAAPPAYIELHAGCQDGGEDNFKGRKNP